MIPSVATLWLPQSHHAAATGIDTGLALIIGAVAFLAALSVGAHFLLERMDRRIGRSITQ